MTERRRHGEAVQSRAKHAPPAIRALSLLLLSIASAHAQTTITISANPAAPFTEALSTSFQSAPWTDPSFLAHPEIPHLLNQLNPHHIRVQVIDKSIPETAPNTWDFTALDRQLQPILTAADRSPELQLAQAPAFLYASKTNFVTPAFIAGYADYAAHMVRHYPTIRYWGILNEPDDFHISPADYVILYNAAASAMRGVDPTIQLVALELGGEPTDERAYIPTFVRRVTAPVDILAIHLYSTCDQTDTDQTVFNTIPAFAKRIHAIRTEMNRNPALRHVPIWVLENNINADFINDRGNSTCDPTRKFIQDARGASPFFAAWRAYEFSRLGQAGAEALYHWVFNGNQQDSEYNTEATPAHLQLSYWVDLWLNKLYPPDIPTRVLAVTNPDPNLEVLAVQQNPGTITLMIANHTVANPTDNNGKGQPRTVTLDLSALSPQTITQITLDATTDPTTGPTPQKITPSLQVTLQLNGYGVTFLTLQ